MNPAARRFIVAAAVGLVLAIGGHLLGSVVRAQSGLLVTPIDGTTVTPETLAALLVSGGSGVTIVPGSVHYTGNDLAAGTFSEDDGILGIASGIILSSGKVVDVVGPNDLDSTTTTFCDDLDTFDFNECTIAPGGDSDLQTLIPGYPTFDASVLEFDFVPTQDHVTFKYVFSSEEYNEWTNSPYNNVFGFFINGVNYALLPGGITPVSINNVNGGRRWDDGTGECTDLIDNDADGLVDADDPDCTTSNDNIVGELNSNSVFFINNDCSDLDGAEVACVIDIQADGLTTVLTLQAPVVPNETNHIRLGIADAGDSFYDSWVFIEAGSFATLLPELCDPNTGGPNGINEDGDEFTDEGCFVEGVPTGDGQFTTVAGDNTETYTFSFGGFGSPLGTTLNITEEMVLQDHQLRFFAVLHDPRDIKARLNIPPFYVTTNCAPLKSDTPGELGMCAEYVAAGTGGFGTQPPQEGFDFAGDITWVNTFKTSQEFLFGEWGMAHAPGDTPGSQFTEDILLQITIDPNEDPIGAGESDSFSSMVMVVTPNLIVEATGLNPNAAMVGYSPMFTPDTPADANPDPDLVICTPASGSFFPLGITLVNCEGNYNDPMAPEGFGVATGGFAVTVVDTTPNICPLYDQAKVWKSGSTVPIKLQLCSASGDNLSSPGVILHATELTQITDTPLTAPVQDSGKANPGNNFRYDAALQGYIFNLSTKGLAPGTWRLSFSASLTGSVIYTVDFGVR